MKLRIAHRGAFLTALLGLLATMVPSAQATTIKTITFSGNADFSTGFGYPCTPRNLNQCPPNVVPDVKTGPKNEPQVNITPQGNYAGFRFRSAVCTKASVSSIDKPNPKTSPADICVLDASGAVWGFCGFSTGIGVATITSATKATISTNFKFTGVGGILHVSGGNKETNIYAEVTIIPGPEDPYCMSEKNKRFLLTGVAVYKDCTGQIANTGVCDPT